MATKYFILLIGFSTLLLQSCVPVESESSIRTPQGDAIRLKISNPSTNDFYTMKSIMNRLYVVKVDTFSADSISLIYLTNDQGYSKGEGQDRGEILLKRKPMTIVKVAKSDLINSENFTSRSNGFFGKVVLPSLGNNSTLEISRLSRHVGNLQEQAVKIRDTLVEQAVVGVYNRFMNMSSTLNPAFALLDSASVDYLNTVLKTAHSDDVNEIKQFILDSDFPTVEYQVMLYTKYLFLKKYKNKKLPRVQKLINEYVFFYQAFCPSIWSMNEEMKNAKIGLVHLRFTNTAQADMEAKANILTTKNSNFFSNPSEKSDFPFPIYFKLNFNLENGDWKVNLPSSYDYIHQQIRRVSHDPKKNWDKQTGEKGEISYRALIRKELVQIDSTIVIAEELDY